MRRFEPIDTAFLIVMLALLRLAAIGASHTTAANQFPLVVVVAVAVAVSRRVGVPSACALLVFVLPCDLIVTDDGVDHPQMEGRISVALVATPFAEVRLALAVGAALGFLVILGGRFDHAVAVIVTASILEVAAFVTITSLRRTAEQLPRATALPSAEHRSHLAR